MQTRCPTCYRVESHTAGGVTIVNPGGLRRAPEPQDLAAWQIVRAALANGPGVVGACAACGSPTVSDDKRSATWTITLPDGVIQITDGRIAGPSGELTVDEADALIEQALVVKQSLAMTLYQGAMVSWLIVPFMVWIGAMVCFSLFLCIGVPHGAAFMTR